MLSQTFTNLTPKNLISGLLPQKRLAQRIKVGMLSDMGHELKVLRPSAGTQAGHLGFASRQEGLGLNRRWLQIE